MTTHAPESDFAAPPPAAILLKPKLSLKIIGLGGAGCNVLAHIAGLGLEGIETLAINTDAAALDRCPVPNKMVLGAGLTRGLGAGGDPERGRAAAEEDRERLSSLCAGTDILVLLAGLGGGTGTGASPVLAEMARQAGVLVLGMAVLPFEWEGARRRRQAQLGLQALKASADVVVCLPNQKLLGMVGDRTGIQEGFAMAHELLASGVRGLWRMLTEPGLVNVDFADLCTVTRGRHAECVMATAEAQGESRGRELVERLLGHPLMDEGRLLQDAQVVLLGLAGGSDLALTDVNELMSQINPLCPHAHIIWGASVDDTASNRLSVTVLAARRLPVEHVETADEPQPNVAHGAGAPFCEPMDAARPPSRFVAPPPAITPANADQMLQGLAPRARRKAVKMVQGQLPLDVVSKGRFEKSHATIRSGQDLDVPTYLRRNLVLN